MKTLDQSVSDAIDSIKKSSYKGTAIKVELEGQLNRYSSDCPNCHSDGETQCAECDGNGTIGEDLANCRVCDGEGWIQCSGHTSKEWEVEDCQEFIKENVSAEANKKLVFGEFYDDGSVDSEFTFTLMLDDLEYVTEFIQAFKKLGDTIGNGIKTEGAGMHVAILNQKKGNYPSGNQLSMKCFDNFAATMARLMPALFFLGSADHRSRGLNYRYPKVSEDKYSAVNGGTGALEFRIFETCYDRPEAILDYVCVIAKCLQFYTAKRVELPFKKIGDLAFINNGTYLERFYISQAHLDALNAGLAILKPDHKTITQLKKERNFKVSRTTLQARLRKEKAKWQQEYAELQDRLKNPPDYVSSQLADRRAYYATKYESILSMDGPGHFGSMSKAKWIEACLQDTGYVTKLPPSTKFIKDKEGQYYNPSGASMVTV